MSDVPVPINLGVPVPAEAASVEEAMRAHWKSASPESGEAAIVRSCSCNLVVLVRDAAEAAGMMQILAALSEWHPHRSVVVWTRTDQSAGAAPVGMRIWIGAQCALPVGGSSQICSESIAIESIGSVVSSLAGNIAALFVPDIPVYMYWRSFREADRELAATLTRFSDVVIVDTHFSKDDPGGRDRLLQTLVSPGGCRSIRDLNWERLTPWRDLLTQFFDAPAQRHLAREIRSVWVERSIAVAGNVPTRTLLLTGWLASRLGWRLRSASCNRDMWRSEWDSLSGNVGVHFSGRVERAGEPSGISSIRIETNSGAKLSVVRESGSTVMTSRTEGTVADVQHSVVQPPFDEAHLLAAELALAGEDAGFRAALSEAMKLEKSFREAY